MIEHASTNDKRMQQVAMIQMVRDQIQEEFDGGNGFGIHFFVRLNLHGYHHWQGLVAMTLSLKRQQIVPVLAVKV